MKKKKTPKYSFMRAKGKLLQLAMFIIAVMLYLPLAANASMLLQSQIVSIKVSNATIIEVFNNLEKQSHIGFFYKKDQLDLTKHYSFDYKDVSLKVILDQVFKDQKSSYEVVGSNVVVKNAEAPKSAAPATLQPKLQNTTKGIVLDDKNTPLPGVSILVAGSKSGGTASDVDGRFSLDNLKVGDRIVFSFIGMEPFELVYNNESSLSITLHSSAQKLDEVVVVGFGVQKKVNLTGSISTLNSKEITDRPINSTVEALQGTIPGINISTGDGGGALNSNKSFNIRGTGTIGAGSNASPLVLIDGMEGDMNTINPQDIENISVLKDAAASSIYGSRAPSGVILITTKKGKSGKAIVNYNNNFRFSSPLNLPTPANSYEYAIFFNDADPNGNTFTDAKLLQIKDYMEGKTATNMWANSGGRWEIWDDPNLLPAGNTNWLKTHFGNSFSQEHSVSVNGGTEQAQYYLSANVLDQGGLLNYGNDNKQRYSLNAKINFQINKNISAGYNVRVVRSDYDAPSYLNDVFYHNVTRYWPIIPLKDPNGFYNADSKYYSLTQGGRYKSQEDITSQQLTFVIEPVENWKINAELNYRVNNNFQHTDVLTTYGYDVNKNPFIYENETSGVTEYAYKSNFFNPNIYSEYTKQLENGHRIKAMVGFQSELYKDRNISASKDMVQSNDIPTLNTTQSNPQTSGGYGNWATAGFFGRLNYDYQGRYLVEGNIRYDGTSRFLGDQRWNIFPSFSLGWNIAQEPFFKEYTNIISTLKVRGSWGELGNQNTDNWYPFYHTIDFNKNNDGNFALGNWLINGQKPNIAAESGLVSSLLTWERIQTTNIGIDINAFDNRFSATFDWFLRKSLDMVGPAPELPNILGTNVPKINNLDMESKGFELQISWRDKIKDVSYGISFNLSDARQKITRYPNPSMNISQKYYDGAYLNDIWGYETIGIAKTNEEMNAHLASLPNGGQNALGSNWAAGDIMYKDLNGDGVINTGDGTVNNPGDQKIIGNSTPRYNFGLNLDAQWHGFDVKIFFQGVLKRDYMASGMMFWGADGGKWQSMAYKPHLDYFRNDPNDPLGLNLDSYYPRLNWNDAKDRQTQTRYLQNAAYVRLKNFTVGYTLPTNLTKRINVSNLRLFVSGENLLTFTKLSKMFDPETLGLGWADGKTYPLSRTYSVGASLTF